MTESVRVIHASVIIPTRNGMPRFGLVLDQVLAQQTPWPYEVIVIDSGSTDGTLDHVARAAGRVRLITLDPAGFGHGRTRNQAIAASKGVFVAMLTHDAMPADPHWLANLVASVEADDHVAGAFGRHIAYPDASPFTRHSLETFFDRFARGPAVVTSTTQQIGPATDTQRRQFLHFFSDNNACLRRSAWEQHPYPDVEFAEDQIWAETVLKAGWAKAYTDEARVYHSHDFGLAETVQRSFDEARSFEVLFGYRRTRSLIHAVGAAGMVTIRQYRWAFGAGVWRRYPLAMLRQPVINLAAYLGFHLGSRHRSLSPWWRRRLSRDQRLRAPALINERRSP